MQNYFMMTVFKKFRSYLFLVPLYSLLFSQADAQPSIPVDPLTGNPQINIPIWKLSEGGISVPVGIYYEGGGVKVEQGEGSAGMSWNLEAGGSVTRDLRGLPDDYSVVGDNRKGWLFDNISSLVNGFTPGSDDNLSVCSDEGNDYTFLAGLGFTKDPEPDLFGVNAPGLSVQFVFGSDGLPKTIPYQDLKFEVHKNLNGGITGFDITTNAGYVYTFFITETTTRVANKTADAVVTHFTKDYFYYSSPVKYVAAWKLSRITSPSGSMITFNYDISVQSHISKKVRVVGESGVVSTLYFILNETNQADLRSINSSATELHFEWEGPRISRISIKDKISENEKLFHFEYVYVTDYRDTNLATRKRKAWLKKVTQETNCQTYPSYEFEYWDVTGNPVNNYSYTTSLPFKGENLQDIYGYYNGTSEDNIPDIYVYAYRSDAEKYRLHPLPGISPTSILSGSNRQVSPMAVKTGALTQIEYPSGANADITYEPNTYFDQEANTSFPAGGIRVKNVLISGVEKGSQPVEWNYEYKSPNGESSGRLLYRPVFAFADGDSIVRVLDDLAPEGGLMYANTTVDQTGHGKTVYEFNVPAMYPAVSHNDWIATNSRIARQTGGTCSPLGNQHTGKYSFPFAPNSILDFERGLPSKVSEYAENGVVPVQEKIYSYQSLTPGIIEVKGIRFEKLPNNFIYGAYSLKTNVGKVVLTELVRTADDLVPNKFIERTTAYTYSSTHHLLASVSMTNSDGVVHKSTYRYARDFNNITNPAVGHAPSIALKALNDKFAHGSVVEITESKIKGQTETVTGSSLVLYKDYGSDRILPSNQLSFPAMSGFTPATTVNQGEAQMFQQHTGYLSTMNYVSYSSKGLLNSFTDHRKSKGGIQYGFNGTLAVAQIQNALAEEVVYTDFEGLTDQSLTVFSGFPSVVPGWLGKYGRSITSSAVLRKENVKKGGTVYRYSLWMKSANAATVTFKVLDGTSLVVSADAVYSGNDADQWKYVEGTVDLTSVPDLFTLEVSSGSVAEVDEIRFLPLHASIVTTSYDPLNGMTSQTDDRGVSSFTEYDELGRVKLTRDRKRDIVQLYEYRYKKQPAPKVRSTFSSNKSGNDIKVGSPISFSATENCLGELTYQWKINGENAGSGATLLYFPSAATMLYVELTVSHPDYGYSTSMVGYCVSPADLNFSIKIIDVAGILPAYNIYRCQDNYAKQFVVEYQSGGCGNSDFTYHWAYQPPGSNGWYSFGNGNATESMSLHFQGYAVRCTIQQNNCHLDDNFCSLASNEVTVNTAVYYIHESYCP